MDEYKVVHHSIILPKLEWPWNAGGGSTPSATGECAQQGNETMILQYAWTVRRFAFLSTQNLQAGETSPKIVLVFVVALQAA
jgi:hypothetical protein